MVKRRNILPGVPHRITHIGNNYQSVFIRDRDFREFLHWLEEHSGRHGVDVGAYLILEDRYELILRPASPEALSTFLHRLNGRYSTYFTRRYRWHGSPWIGPYEARPIAESWLLDLLRYLLQIPVRTGLAKHLIDYPWSSFAGHLGSPPDPILSDSFPDELLPEGWAGQLKVPLPDEIVARIEARTNQRGRPPYGDVKSRESPAEPA